MHPADRDGIEVVQLLPAGALRGHQPGRLEHGQVLHHAEAGHPRQRGGQLDECSSVPLEQRIEQYPPAGVGQRLEHGIHERDYR